MGRSLRSALAWANGSGQLADLDPAGRPVEPKHKLGKAIARSGERIADLQERLWASSTAGSTRSVLLVLQGIDTAGKGGTTEHVVGACGPIGVRYTAFKKPTEEERAHDFLWRIRPHVPEPGVISVFDRSHYEDVLVVRVHDLVPRDELEQRYAQINEFEQSVVDADVVVIKCLLNVSYDEQRTRLLARLDDPTKYWKFNPADVDERAYWASYQDAFQAMLERCDTPSAPWYVIPSDSKKYRNWAVGQILRETLTDLDPQYPPAPADLVAQRARLAPPH